MANTPRLPIPGQDDGTWGDILNSFLGVEHNVDGSLKIRTDGSVAPLVSGKIPATNLGSGSASSSNFLRGDGTWAVPSGVAATGATTTSTGLIQLSGDLGGSGTSATTPVISDGAITNSKLAVGAVTTAKLGAGSVTSNEIADATITNTDISSTAAIGRTKLDSSTQTSLGKADTALQSAPVSSVNAQTGAVTLTKSDVGLANVDNTSDINKPVSSATQTALNAKANTSSLATVATSGSYTDLSNKPAIPNVGTTSVGGDLSGTVSSATVAKVNGVTISNAPTNNQVLTATSTTAASWSTPVSGFSDPTTTKGDLIIHGSSTTRQPIGSDGQVLTADSTQVTGAKWATPTSAPVTSVAGKTGVVTLTETDITNLTSDLAAKASTSSLAAVATSGSYTDLSNKPTIFTLDATATDIVADTTTGTAVAGSTGKAADAGHQHPLVAHDHTTTNKGGQIPVAGLNATGTASSSTYLRGDGSWSAPSATDSTKLAIANNLSDLASASTARTNLGLGTAAAANIVAAGSTGVLDATDSTTTNARTPSGSASGDLSGTYPSPSVAKVNGIAVSGTPSSGQVLTATGTTAASWQASPGVTALTATTVQTTSYTASANQLVPADATSGAVTVTLPTAPVDKTRMVIKKVDSSANAVTVAAGGSDVFNKSGGSTTGSLSLLNQAITLQYVNATGIWYITADDIPLSQTDTRYLQKTNNLSDLASASTARTNLGLGNAATLNIGTTTGTIADGGAAVQIDANGHFAVSVSSNQWRYLSRRAGSLSETFSRVGASYSYQTIASGQIQVQALPLLKGQVISKIAFVSGTTALSGGSNQWFCLYTPSLALAAVTADDTATTWATNTEKQLTIASPYTVPSDGLYYIGCMVNATTPPTLISASTVAGIVALAPILSGRDTTHTGLTNPASAPTTLTLAANTVQPYGWVS